MKIAPLVLCLSMSTVAAAQSPEAAANAYFAALAKSDKNVLVDIVHEPSATRIGKSILAASPMLHRSGDSDFFEMIFERVPSSAEIETMSPVQAFAEYMCEPTETEEDNPVVRTILGSVAEGDSLAHVVYRVNGMPNLSEKSRDVLTCVKHSGEWRVVVSPRVWDAYMNFMLQPAMARLSEKKAAHSDAPASASRGELEMEDLPRGPGDR
ncbi:hypothetical protein [Aureliella helgolandensis]|uniref:Nuclear transport factor 2 family protein n=1 Tax=Aureliella helgolandensis TaxID=2527968 RepID=A0A518G0W8_9BACT|nr:hypothetical protein [Aureliella helgolandensis]QDV22243.1 hypothetical protein Q31a_05270 [Aureliella helgolandensis]